MSNKPFKKLSINKETLRRLLDDQLASVNGGAMCETRVVSGCSTKTQDKCTNRPQCNTDAC